MKKIFFFAVLLFLVSVGQTFAQNQKAFTIAAGRYHYFPFSLGGDGGTIAGRFEAQGGAHNDVEVFIVNSDEFQNYKNGNGFNSFYTSGRRTVGTFNVRLRAGDYYLIFSNTFSTISNKAVTLNSNLR